MMIIFKDGPKNDGAEHDGVLRETAANPQGGTTIWIERHSNVTVTKYLQMPQVMFREIYSSAERKGESFINITDEGALMKHHPKAVKRALEMLGAAEVVKLNQMLADYLDVEEARAAHLAGVAARVQEKFGKHATVEILRKPPSERLVAIQDAARARAEEVQAEKAAATSDPLAPTVTAGGELAATLAVAANVVNPATLAEASARLRSGGAVAVVADEAVVDDPSGRVMIDASQVAAEGHMPGPDVVRH